MDGHARGTLRRRLLNRSPPGAVSLLRQSSGQCGGPSYVFFLEKMGPLVCGSVENTIVLFNPVDPRELILWAAAVY